MEKKQRLEPVPMDDYEDDGWGHRLQDIHLDRQIE